MLVHLLVQKSAQSNSVIGELKDTLHVVTEGAPKIFFREHEKLHKKITKKISHCNWWSTWQCNWGSLEGADKDTLNDQRKDAQESTMTFENSKML